MFDGVINPAIGLNSAYNAPLLKTLSHLPHVRRVASTVELNMGPTSRAGQPLPNNAGAPPAEASVDGLDLTEDPLVITEGRMLDPHNADEVVIDAASAKALGYQVGQEIPIGWLSNEQTQSGNVTQNEKIPSEQRATVKLVGLSGGQATTMFQDGDSAHSQSIMLFSPALTNKLLSCCSNDMVSGLTLKDGNRYLSTVETEVRNVLPKGLPFVYVQVGSRRQADNTLRPEAIAWRVFGGIAGVAALLIAGQVISRRIRLRSDDLDIVRALGASPSMELWDSLIGTLGMVVAGSLLAGLVAFGLSPLAPLGPVRQLLPVGLHADWAVLLLGVVGLILALGAVAFVAAASSLPGAAHTRPLRPSASWAATGAIRAGLPPSAVTGVRFALEPGAGRSAVPVRSAILGAILAVVVVVATVTFGSSLDTLVSHPALYGWNWTYDMDGGGGLGDIPGEAAAKLLNADPHVKGWTGVYFSTLQLDGVNEPVLGGTPNAAVAPPLIDGHGLQSANQVVLGAATLRQLHRQIGDTVEVRRSQRQTGEAHDRRHRNHAAHRCRRVLASPHGHRCSALLQADPGCGAEPLRGHAGSQRDPGPHEGGRERRGTALAPGHRAQAGHRDQRRLGAARAAAGGDHQLRVLGHDPRAARRGTGRRGGGGARHHPGDLGQAQAARPGDTQDARLHRTSVGGRRVRAGWRCRRHRLRGRDPGGDRPRARALGPVRRRDQCRAPSNRPRSRPSSSSGSWPSCWPS